GFRDRPRPLRAGPAERHDPMPRIGRSMDGDPAPPLAVIDPQPADPAHELLDRKRPVAGRDTGSEMDEGVAGGAALPVPGSASSDRQFDLDRRLEPVDIR